MEGTREKQSPRSMERLQGQSTRRSRPRDGSNGRNIESSRVGSSALPISLGRQRPLALCNGPNRGARLLAPDAARSERPIQKVVLPFLNSEALAHSRARGIEESCGRRGSGEASARGGKQGGALAGSLDLSLALACKTKGAMMLAARPWNITCTFPSARSARGFTLCALETCPLTIVVQPFARSLHVRVTSGTVQKEISTHEVLTQTVGPGFRQAVLGNLLKLIRNKLVLAPGGSSPVEQLGGFDLKCALMPRCAFRNGHAHAHGK
jgi:hypothetical protein